MKKVIRVIVGPKGETKIETKGFSGGECREASRFLEQALGQPVNEQLTAEFYQSQADRPADPAVAVMSASARERLSIELRSAPCEVARSRSRDLSHGARHRSTPGVKWTTSRGLKGRRNPARVKPGARRTCARRVPPDGVPEGFPAALQAARAAGSPRTPGFTRGWAPAALQAAADRLLSCATHPLGASRIGRIRLADPITDLGARRSDRTGIGPRCRQLEAGPVPRASARGDIERERRTGNRRARCGSMQAGRGTRRRLDRRGSRRRRRPGRRGRSIGRGRFRYRPCAEVKPPAN